MKNSLWILLIVVILCVGAATASSDTEKEIIKALNIQNQQLARIATSLERMSGQQK
jgi:hypothetical protein